MSAGRGIDGTAKPIKTDNAGNTIVSFKSGVSTTRNTEITGYAGKKQGTNATIPHIAKINQTSASLTEAPATFTAEFTDTNYSNISTETTGSSVTVNTASAAGRYAKHLFGFNLLAYLKGKDLIPSSWSNRDLMAEIESVTIKWLGYGEGASAGATVFGASLKMWKSTGGAGNWTEIGTTLSSAGAAVTVTLTDLVNAIQDDGFIYFMVHPSHPSDGTITSRIYSFFANLKVDFFTEKLKTSSVMSKSALQRRTSITNELFVPLNTQTVILNNYELTDNVTAWGLYGFEITRPIAHLLQGQLQLLVEYSNVSGDFTTAQGGGKTVFRKVVDFASADEADKGLALISDSSAASGTNMIVTGKWFNIPMARYMRLTLINKTTTVGFRFLPFSLVEEGNF